MALPSGDRKSCHLLTAVISIVAAHEPARSCLLLDPGPPVLLPHEMFWSTSKVSPLELKPQLLDGIFTSVPAASGLVTASCQFSITDHLCTAAVTAASPVEAGLE